MDIQVRKEKKKTLAKRKRSTSQIRYKQKKEGTFLFFTYYSSINNRRKNKLFLQDIPSEVVKIHKEYFYWHNEIDDWKVI
jgi:hypothetical protein